MRSKRAHIIGAAIALIAALVLAPAAHAQASPTGAPSGADRGSASDESPRPDRRAVAGQVARTRGQPEFIALGPAAEAALTANALLAAGATQIRRRDYPGLGRVGQVFLLPRGLSLAQAQALLSTAAPRTRFDAHHLYGYAGGAPRVYAPALVSGGAGCRLPAGRTVGIIDGPVDRGHPALAGARIDSVALMGDARGESPDHGTAVAALIVGEDSGSALGGFAPGARLIAVDAFSGMGTRGRTDVELIGAGLDLLLRSDVRLVNLSISGPANAALADLLSAAAAQGMVMIAAAGNDAGRVGWPAAAPEVIAVTAVDAALHPYRRANTGPEVEFAAPGVDLWAARKGGGAYVSGTSYAAPIATALAARLGAGRTLTTEQLRRALRASARDLGPAGRDTQTGWGLVQGSGC
ncbi:S8 family serine peptidase [Sedimentimonas flavescens]|uniref:S8 family serine peptidase n=1 Tax=Sedimentimonas flavescens TaxID=2851012 RepID=A0ABT2ZYY3_9RHOB|nr:S8 family serine peptidase [Sedimentimonas flavescens]MCV2878960.1 S8 family serine peptidase [Sedimentimonas flavescens]